MGELGVDAAAEAQGNYEVIALDPLAATFLAFYFTFWMRSFLGISSWVSTQPTRLNKLQVFLKQKKALYGSSQSEMFLKVPVCRK